MKMPDHSTAETANRVLDPGHDSQSQLTENALYAIALISILKEKILPGTIKDHLKAFKNELAN